MLIQPSTTADWSAPPQLTPEERMTPPPMAMPPDDCTLPLDGATSSSIRLCVRCAREFEPACRSADQDANFCSNNCYKSYQRHRANSDGGSSTAAKKGKYRQNKRAKLDDAQLLDIGNVETENCTVSIYVQLFLCFLVPTTTPSNTSSPKRSATETPSELPSASNSFTLEEPSPPLVSEKNPIEWTVNKDR